MYLLILYNFSEIYEELPLNYPKIIHLYDIWHFVKSVMKDLFQAAKLKSCSELGRWTTSIQNQLWWCFSSSVGNLVMLREKLNSITDHMCNIHEFPDNEVFKKCEHRDLSLEERQKAWLSPDSLVFIIPVLVLLEIKEK